MKYAIKFYRDCRILDKADEIIINYTEKSDNLINFVQKWEDSQRVVINITELEENIEGNLYIFNEARKVHPNFAVLMSYDQDYSLIAELNIPYFFINGISSYDDLHHQIRLGVSDVYIINEFGFNIEKISEYCHKNKVKVRVIPNIAQTNSNLSLNSLTKFFIRPEAVEFYEDFVDIFEFFGPLDKQPVLYDIYKSEKWLGGLDEIILDLNIDLDNTTIVPYFDLSRIKCNKKCNFDKCNICERVKSIGYSLGEEEIRIIKKDR